MKRLAGIAACDINRLSEPRGTIAAMTVTGHLDVVAFDAPDIDKLASFYADLAGWPIAGKDSDWIALRTSDGP